MNGTSFHCRIATKVALSEISKGNLFESNLVVIDTLDLIMRGSSGTNDE